MTKDDLRKDLRIARRDHVTALPASMRTLVFMRPPAPLARWYPRVRRSAFTMPILTKRPPQPMRAISSSRVTNWPCRASPVAAKPCCTLHRSLRRQRPGKGPYGQPQPADAPLVQPEVLFVPLVGFTSQGARLGQGGGHYDRWLADHPDTMAIGLAWDCQLVDALPVEPHDIPLTAIITPTRIYGPFA